MFIKYVWNVVTALFMIIEQQKIDTTDGSVNYYNVTRGYYNCKNIAMLLMWDIEFHTYDNLFNIYAYKVADFTW